LQHARHVLFRLARDFHQRFDGRIFRFSAHDDELHSMMICASFDADDDGKKKSLKSKFFFDLFLPFFSFFFSLFGFVYLGF
tara:strand:- start:91 stop:333 length:243 start_codon:yes stop_codon:yes gene_type:complete